MDSDVGSLLVPIPAGQVTLSDRRTRRTWGEQLQEVGGKAPNPWGLYDMLGNVWDWCWDTYDAEVYGDYKVLRGGGWFDEHWSCRASVRRRGNPDFRVDDVGFRLARSAPR